MLKNILILRTDSRCHVVFRLQGNVRITWHSSAFVQTLLQWKSNKYYILWMCVCSLRYPACNAHVPYDIVIRGLPGCTIFFSRYLINGTIVGEKKLMNIKTVFWFYLQHSSETFLILRGTERHMIKMYIGLHVKYPLFLSDFNLLKPSGFFTYHQV